MESAIAQLNWIDWVFVAAGAGCVFGLVLEWAINPDFSRRIVAFTGGPTWGWILVSLLIFIGFVISLLTAFEWFPLGLLFSITAFCMSMVLLRELFAR